jgi:hypothetical protein
MNTETPDRSCSAIVLLQWPRNGLIADSLLPNAGLGMVCGVHGKVRARIGPPRSSFRNPRVSTGTATLIRRKHDDHNFS